MTIKRNGQNIEFNKITPKKDELGQYKIGITFGAEKMSPTVAVKASVKETCFITKYVVKELCKLVGGRAPVSELSGPVGVGTAIGGAVQQGAQTQDYSMLWYIIASISVNVGIFNLLPLPALDGGRILFMLVELVRRKPIPPEKEGYVHLVGFALLMLLAVVVMSSDIYKLVNPLFHK
jgi:regulator of sigma E protease